MKKIIVLIAAASLFVFSGCFIDSDTATVRINLGNIPVAKMEKKSLIDRFLMIFAKEAVAQSVPEDLGISEINFKVFEGDSLLVEENILISEYPADNIVELTVSAGTNRLIRISAKDKEGALPAKVVYGVMITTDLSPGQTKEIKAYMQGVPYEISAFVGDPINGTLTMSWSMEGPKSENYIIEWAEETNGSYTELLQINSSLTSFLESVFTYDFSIESGSPVKPSNYIRVRTNDGQGVGIFCEPVPVTGN